MGPNLKEQMLEGWRGMVANQRDALATWRETNMRLWSNGENITDQALTELEQQIERLQSLINRVEAADAQGS